MSMQKGAAPEIQHPSVGALLAAHPGESDPENLMRRLARAKIAYAKGFGWDGPPFCPIKFSSLFKVQCSEVTHDIGGDGRILLNRNGRLEIEYHKDALPERQRFTIFHEFAHMLFPDYCEFLPHHYTRDEIESLEHRQFENLCDIGATEMLFPHEEFSADLKKHSHIDLGAIEDLRKLYFASIDATTQRAIALAGNAALSAAFLMDQKGKYEGSGPLWVKYSKKTSRFNGFIWPGTCPPVNSVANKCYKTNKSYHEPCLETWSVKGQSKRFRIQATRLPDFPEDPYYPKVLVLFFPPA
jgi:Zn-dependent peptidase ImmA (M78 family)